MPCDCSSPGLSDYHKSTPIHPLKSCLVYSVALLLLLFCPRGYHSSVTSLTSLSCRARHIILSDEYLGRCNEWGHECIPTWQFWDPGGVKLESLCNFSIVRSCQPVLQCAQGYCFGTLFYVSVGGTLYSMHRRQWIAFAFWSFSHWVSEVR